MAEVSIFKREPKKSDDGFPFSAPTQPLFSRRIEFQPAKKPFSPFTANGADFQLETLNPSSSDAPRTALSVSGAAAVAGKRSEGAAGEFFEHGLDTELSFRITFRRIVSTSIDEIVWFCVVGFIVSLEQRFDVELDEHLIVGPMGAGLANLGNTCFLNSVLQCLTYTEPFAAYLQSGKHKSSCHTAGFCALCALQNHVRTALESSGKIVSPHHLVNNLRCILIALLDVPPYIVTDLVLGRSLSNFRISRQEDAHEYMVNLLESMHKCCLPTGVSSESPSAYEKSLVHKIFGGRLRSQVKCTQCSFCSNKFDPFLDLSLEIVKADSVNKALARFTAVEQLDGGERQYQCQRCQEKVRALKQLTVHKAPDVLTIHLKRFSSHMPDQKINKKVDFDTTLDLKPFASDPHDGDLKYTLYGVLVHAGCSTRAGHYYCYVRTSSGMWYSLDDNQVIQVSQKTVLEQKAYMLFYIRNRKSLDPKKLLNAVRKENMVANAAGNKKIPASVASCSIPAKGGIMERLSMSKCVAAETEAEKLVAENQSVAVVPTFSNDPVSKKVSTVQAGFQVKVESMQQSTPSDNAKLNPPSSNTTLEASSSRDPSILRNATEGPLSKNNSNSAAHPDDATIATEDSKIDPGNAHRSSECVPSELNNQPSALVVPNNLHDGLQKPSVLVPDSGNGICQKTGNAEGLVHSQGTGTTEPKAEKIKGRNISNPSSASNDDHGKNHVTSSSGDVPCLPSRENDEKVEETMSGGPSRLLVDVSCSVLETVNPRCVKCKPKKFLKLLPIASPHLGPKRLFLVSLCLRKRKKHKRSKRRHCQDARKKALIADSVCSDQELSTSGRGRMGNLESTDGQDQHSHPVSSDEKNHGAADDVAGFGDISRGKRCGSREGGGPSSAVLATNEPLEKKRSMENQCDLRETEFQLKGRSGQHGLVTMLMRGLEEVTGGFLRGIHLSKLLQMDEEYDQGKRKKVRNSVQSFGGPNPFQEFATEKVHAKKAKLMVRSSSGNRPFRI
ncbi:hypothetical protein ACLOJK_002629 [Asimina triloba]